MMFSLVTRPQWVDLFKWVKKFPAEYIMVCNFEKKNGSDIGLLLEGNKLWLEQMDISHACWSGIYIKVIQQNTI